MKAIMTIFLLMLAFGFGQTEVTIAYAGDEVSDDNCDLMNPTNFSEHGFTPADLQLCTLRSVAENQKITLTVTYFPSNEPEEVFQTQMSNYDFVIEPDFLNSVPTVDFLTNGYDYGDDAKLRRLLPPIRWLSCNCPSPSEGGEGCDAFNLFRETFDTLYPDFLPDSPYSINNP